MIKGQAAGEQFVTRTGSFATRGSRTGVDLLGLGAGEQEELTLQQEREVLNTVRTGVELELANIKTALERNLPFREARALQERSRELGLRLCETNKRAAEIKAALAQTKAADVGQFIIRVVKERMTKPEWAAVVKEAQRRYDSGEII